MHSVPADHRRLGPRQVRRSEHERVRLAAAHAAVGADELLEGRNLVQVLPVGRVDHDVRAVREAVRARDVRRRVRPVRRERVHAFHHARGEIVPPAGPQHDAVDHHEADARMA